MKFNYIIAAQIALSSVSIAAQPYEDVTALDLKVVEITGSEIGKPNGALAPIDRRLKLAQCPEAIIVETPRLQAVTLRCAALGWRIRVPLTMSNTSSANYEMSTKAEFLVRRGDPVELIISGDDYQIDATAIALDDGAINSAVRVKVPTIKTPLLATVKSRGVVFMPD